MKKIVAFILTISLILILFLGIKDLPEFGSPNSPSNNEVYEYYVENAIKDTGATNIVTGVILDYRAFDTFIESSVLFTSVATVMIVLKKQNKNSK